VLQDDTDDVSLKRGAPLGITLCCGEALCDTETLDDTVNEAVALAVDDGLAASLRGADAASADSLGDVDVLCEDDALPSAARLADAQSDALGDAAARVVVNEAVDDPLSEAVRVTDADELMDAVGDAITVAEGVAGSAQPASSAAEGTAEQLTRRTALKPAPLLQSATKIAPSVCRTARRFGLVKDASVPRPSPLDMVPLPASVLTLAQSDTARTRKLYWSLTTR
jgi:hypothetical protein